MRKIVLTFGLLAGGVLSATLLATLPFQDAIGFDKGAVIGYTSMVLAFLLIFFGVRSYRDTVAGGTIGFGRALAVGALIGVIASACYVVTWEVVFFKFAPDFLQKYEAHAVERARAKGESEEAIARTQAEMREFAEMYRNPVFNAAITFLEPLPVWTVMALVTAGVVRRKPRAVVAVPGPSPVA